MCQNTGGRTRLALAASAKLAATCASAVADVPGHACLPGQTGTYLAEGCLKAYAEVRAGAVFEPTCYGNTSDIHRIFDHALCSTLRKGTSEFICKSRDAVGGACHHPKKKKNCVCRRLARRLNLTASVQIG